MLPVLVTYSYPMSAGMGNKYTLSRGVTSMRWTFLISKSGEVIYKNDQVAPSKDSQTVLEFIDKLK